MVKQISVFLENKSGRLVRVAQVLGAAGINIRGLSIADTSDFGILRLIVDRPDQAMAALQEEGVMATVTQVIALEVPDEPGGLARVLAYLDQAGINIEYLYSFVAKKGQNAILMMRVETIPEALAVLTENNIPLVSEEQIYSL